MSLLTIYPEHSSQDKTVYSHGSDIATQLAAIGVLFERWQPHSPIDESSTPESIMQAYRQDIDRLKKTYGFQSVDVISLSSNHPQKSELRQKFLREHTHSENEVRYFVRGKGLFYIHAQGKVFGVLCESGDLISVPDLMTHWFDMGENPYFTCIRLFTNTEGWVAQYTGSDIASRFPYLNV